MPFIPRTLLTSSAKRYYAVGAASKKRFATVNCITESNRIETNYNANEPVQFKNYFKDIPAYEKWFKCTAELPEGFQADSGTPAEYERGSEDSESVASTPKLDIEYLGQYGDSTVPLELTRINPNGSTSFKRFEGPFSLLLSYITAKEKPSSQLYLAQHSLADLPEALRADLPTPNFLNKLGRGDIYGSSLWMGRAPTRTPLHRDPNPNLFVQLAGKKTIRLIEPRDGKELYERIREKVGRARGTANMRGEEMMEGREMEALESAVWDDEKSQDKMIEGLEVTLKHGDGLYIPLGWWHAVRGVGNGPNVSVSYSVGDEDAILTDPRRSIGGSVERTGLEALHHCGLMPRTIPMA
jgi:hypothetical protein